MIGRKWDVIQGGASAIPSEEVISAYRDLMSGVWTVRFISADVTETYCAALRIAEADGYRVTAIDLANAAQWNALADAISETLNLDAPISNWGLLGDALSELLDGTPRGAFLLFRNARPLWSASTFEAGALMMELQAAAFSWQPRGKVLRAMFELGDAS
jgi:hypothetical protein